MVLYGPYDDLSSAELWNSQEFLEAPTPMVNSVGSTPLPDSVEPVPWPTESFDEDDDDDGNDDENECVNGHASHSKKLPGLNFAEWHPGRAYDEGPPIVPTIRRVGRRHGMEGDLHLVQRQRWC